MILVKRGTLVVMLVIATALGVGLGSWGASAVDLGKPAAPAPRQQVPMQAPMQAGVQAPVVPAALPVASGSFAQVAEAVRGRLAELAGAKHLAHREGEGEPHAAHDERERQHDQKSRTDGDLHVV